MQMIRSRRNNAIVIGLWVNAALLVVMLVGLMLRGDGPAVLPAASAQVRNAPEAAGPQRGQGSGGVQIVPAQLGGTQWGCYVVDLETRRMAVYQYDAGSRLLRLMAARDIRHDLKLEDFNTVPSPQEISRLVERQQPDRPDGQD